MILKSSVTEMPVVARVLTIGSVFAMIVPERSILLLVPRPADCVKISYPRIPVITVALLLGGVAIN